MAYDQHLAHRIRAILGARKDVTERKMFGGLAFLVGGHMCCGIIGNDLMVRVGKEAFDKEVRAPHARPMDFTGKPSTGMVYVAPAGVKTARALRAWVEKGVRLVSMLPARAVSGSAEAKGQVQKAAALPLVRDSRIARLLRSLRADRDLGPAVQEFEERARAGDSKRQFGSNGLKAKGKLFALFTQQTLVVKLPEHRVGQLVESGVGKPFDPGHGRMKEWLTVTSPRASWIALVREAYGFVSSPRRAAPVARRRSP